LFISVLVHRSYRLALSMHLFAFSMTACLDGEPLCLLLGAVLFKVLHCTESSGAVLDRGVEAVQSQLHYQPCSEQTNICIQFNYSPSQSIYWARWTLDLVLFCEHESGACCAFFRSHFLAN